MLIRLHLATASGISQRTILEFENENRLPYTKTARAISESLKKLGIVFVDGVDGQYDACVSILSIKVEK
jgi:DNA-binding XRE family transcriptional regulator